jgi:uncharacterized protein
MAFRILSLDGGGAWALIQVQALIDLYGGETRGNEVLAEYDLAAANSGGSLVLAGLVENLKLSDLSLLFMDEGKRRSIFSPTKDFGNDALRSLAGIGPKYSAEAKLPAIERLLPQTGAKPLQGITETTLGPGGKPVRLLIVGFDYERNRAVYFRSVAATGPGLGTGAPAPAQVTLAGAVHGSTNAPINYFDAPASLPFYPDRIWDGGITGNNNPALAACVEALVCQIPANELRVLSIGTATISLPLSEVGAAATPFYAARPVCSLTGDLGKLAAAILDDPPDAASFIVHTITGGSSGMTAPVISRVVRMNPLISPARQNGQWAAPNGWTAAQFQYLCNLDVDAVDQNQVQYIADWSQLWLQDDAPNQPLRMNGENMAVEVGYGTYSEAKRAWSSLFPRRNLVPVV